MDNKSSRRVLLGLGVVVIVAVVCALYVRVYVRGGVFDVRETELLNEVACTKEAQICPDGSSVGRVGKMCEFSTCPVNEVTPVPPVVDVTLPSNDATLGKKIQMIGVSLTPLKVLEDSRCPLDVQCIQAGTVRLLVTIESVDQPAKQVILTLQKPFISGNKEITLVSVLPAPVSTQSAEDRKYIFNFTVLPIEVVMFTGILSGTVTVGPLCPVEILGKPCLPTPEQYAAQTLLLYKTDQKAQSKTIVPDATGTFELVLPVGEYHLSLSRGESGPGGAAGLPTTLLITKDTVSKITINIDTGIR